METSLHRFLKEHYAADSESTEVGVDSFRVDAIDSEGWLVEVQHAGLGSIRKKLSTLLESHSVRLIKPLIRCKWIETLDLESEEVVTRRKSPKRADHWDVFAELIHLGTVFPHVNLRLECPLLDVVEQRIPRPHRYRRKKQYQVKDQTVVEIHDSAILHTAHDLWKLLGSPDLPESFGTSDLASVLDRPRWFAQQVAYVLLKCGATECVGKKGNSKLYRCMVHEGLAVTGVKVKTIKRTKKRSA